MLARSMVFGVTLLLGALALEVMFGVNLGIANWVHRVLDPGGLVHL